MVGEATLFAIVLIAQGVLRRGYIPGVLSSDYRYHISAAIIAVAACVTWVKVDPPKQKADRYHHLVILQTRVGR